MDVFQVQLFHCRSCAAIVLIGAELKPTLPFRIAKVHHSNGVTPEVQFTECENGRTTKVLLNYFDIDTPWQVANELKWYLL